MIANKYKIMSKIGNGKFGHVYRGKYTRNDEDVAIKIEILDTPIKLLQHETRILNYINSKHSTSVPFVYWYGLYRGNPTLIMPFYEISLEKYNDNRIVSKKENLLNAVKMIDILKFVHECGVIHCDLKPDNFMIKNNALYLIDFGLSKIYIDDDMKPLPEETGNEFITGTPKFISLHIHIGKSPGRRDDLIAILYIYMFYKNGGNLDWLNIPDTNIENTFPPNHIRYFKNRERMRLKQIHSDNLQSNSLDKKILYYLHRVDFIEKPHYHWMTSLFQEEISLLHDIE